MNSKMKALVFSSFAMAQSLGAYAQGASLPDGYLKLDSVRFTGAQYIDLRAPLTGRQRVEIVYATESTDQQFVYGARGTSATDRNFVHMLTADKLVLDFCDSKGGSVAEGRGRDMIDRPQLGTKLFVCQGAKVRSMNYWGGDEEPVARFDRQLNLDFNCDFSTPGNCYLGSANSTLSGYSKFKGRIYSFKIIDTLTGAVEKDLVPCFQEGSRQVGFFDMSADSATAEAFYGNAGAGDLFPGKVISSSFPVCEVAEDGRTAKVTASPEGTDRTVYLAYGRNDAWHLTNQWDHVVCVGILPAAQSTLDFNMPEGFGESYFAARAFVESASSQGLSSLDYVKDGLILMYDAKDNAGAGLHDSGSLVWTDLSGSGYDMQLPADHTEVGDDVIKFKYTGAGEAWPGSQRPRATVGALAVQGPKTAETVAWADDGIDDMKIVGNTDRMDLLYVGNHGTISFANTPWEYVSGCHLLAVFEDGPQDPYKGHYFADSSSPYNELAALKRRQSYSGFFSPLELSSSTLSVNGAEYVSPSGAAELHSTDMTKEQNFIIGLNRANSYYSVIRLYNRKLTAKERTWNCMVDSLRYRSNALRSSNPCYAKRPLSVLKVNKKGNVPISATVAFEGREDAAIKRKLYVAWGEKDGGDRLQDWENSRFLQEVPNGVGVLDLNFPQEMIDNLGAKEGVRFFLRDPEALTVMDYIRDGLLLLLDAKDNCGLGRHADFPGVWKDLSGKANDMTLPSNNTDARSERMRFTYGGGSGSWSGVNRPKVDPAELKDKAAKTIEVAAHTDASIETDVAAQTERMDFLYMGNYGTLSFSTYPGLNKYLIGAFVEKQGENLVGRYLTNGNSAFNSLSSIKSLNTYSAVFSPSARNKAGLQVNGEPYVQGDDSEWKSISMTDEYQLILGLNRADVFYTSVRLYNRALTDDERAWNAKVDSVRYCQGCMASEFVKINIPGLVLIFK